MMQDNKNSDPKIAQQVSQRLAGCGLRAPSRVTVSSASGQVTLSGSIQYEHQRHPALRAAGGVAGVQRVIDLLKIIAATPKN